MGRLLGRVGDGGYARDARSVTAVRVGGSVRSVREDVARAQRCEQAHIAAESGARRRRPLLAASIVTLAISMHAQRARYCAIRHAVRIYARCTVAAGVGRAQHGAASYCNGAVVKSAMRRAPASHNYRARGCVHVCLGIPRRTRDARSYGHHGTPPCRVTAAYRPLARRRRLPLSLRRQRSPHAA